MSKTVAVGFLRYEQVGFLKIVKKIGLAIPRNAFLAMVKLNAFKLAEKLYKTMKTNEAKLKKKWESLGGSYKALKSAVMKRMEKRFKAGKSVRGIDSDYENGVGNVSLDFIEKNIDPKLANHFWKAGEVISGTDGIGVVPVAALLAAAGPILAALKQFLGDIKKEPEMPPESPE